MTTTKQTLAPCNSTSDVDIAAYEEAHAMSVDPNLLMGCQFSQPYGNSAYVEDHVTSVEDNATNNTLEPLAPVPPPKEQKSKPTVQDFIALVQKVEATHPDWTGEDVLNSLRHLGTDYDSAQFQEMYGTNPGLALSPSEGLSAEDIAALKSMIDHEGNTKDNEKGIVTDGNGIDLAIGHVLTGISAGQHRKSDVNLVPWGLRHLGFGEPVDNLYATTIAGDLGQSATMNNAGQQPGFIGYGTEATDAELTGDIDGFLIGESLPELLNGKSLNENGKNGMSLSALLNSYYYSESAGENVVNGVPIDSRHRFGSYKKTLDKEALTKQVGQFSTNYNYKDNVDPGDSSGWTEFWGYDPEGWFRASGDKSKEATDEFVDWLNQQSATETLRNAAPDENISLKNIA